MDEGRQYDVFLSYSSKNRQTADAIVADLERHGVRCWYAPRDIEPGEEFTKAIMHAIPKAPIFVLLYTPESKDSPHVNSEVLKAFNTGRTLIPFILCEDQMNENMEYCLALAQWVNATTLPVEDTIRVLRKRVQKTLGIEDEEERQRREEEQRRKAAQEAERIRREAEEAERKRKAAEEAERKLREAEEAERRLRETKARRRRERLKAKAPALAAAAVLLVIVAAVFLPKQSWAEGTLSKGKLRLWVETEKVVELNIQNTRDGAPSNAVDLSEEGNGGVLGWMDGNTLYLAGKEGVKAPQDCSYLFSYDGSWRKTTDRKVWDRLECVNGGEWLDFSGTTDMHAIFDSCSSLKSVDVSNWRTDGVTDMSYMFHNCKSLTKLTVTNWETSSVDDMTGMFSGCVSLKSLNVDKWDTSKVTSMGAMFDECYSLTKLAVSNWNTSKVTDMGRMFSGCALLTRLSVNNWNTSEVMDMQGMFAGCFFLSQLQLNNWVTSKVKTMNTMFFLCKSLTKLEVSGWDTSNVKDMSGIFWGCKKLTDLDVSKWNISNVEYAEGMFSGTKWESNPPYPFNQ